MIFYVIVPLLLAIMLYTLAERKVQGFIQHRTSPTIVSPYGLLQNVADGVKFLFKEILIPKESMMILFCLSPILSFFISSFLWVFLPLLDFYYGILLILVIGGIELYGILLGLWASQNKYNLLDFFSSKLIFLFSSFLLLIVCIYFYLPSNIYLILVFNMFRDLGLFLINFIQNEKKYSLMANFLMFLSGILLLLVKASLFPYYNYNGLSIESINTRGYTSIELLPISSSNNTVLNTPLASRPVTPEDLVIDNTDTKLKYISWGAGSILVTTGIGALITGILNIWNNK